MNPNHTKRQLKSRKFKESGYTPKTCFKTINNNDKASPFDSLGHQYLSVTLGSNYP
jgi:hypothetical protein